MRGRLHALKLIGQRGYDGHETEGRVVRDAEGRWKAPTTFEAGLDEVPFMGWIGFPSRSERQNNEEVTAVCQAPKDLDIRQGDDVLAEEISRQIDGRYEIVSVEYGHVMIRCQLKRYDRGADSYAR